MLFSNVRAGILTPEPALLFSKPSLLAGGNVISIRVCDSSSPQPTWGQELRNFWNSLR